jgi:hypothetical protein
MCLQVELYVPFLGWDFGRSPANQFTVALVQFLEVVNLQDFSVVALAQLQDSGNQVFAFVFPWVLRLISIPAEAVLMEFYPPGLAAAGV